MLFDPYPKYQNGLPGHDWDIINLKFDQTNIQMIENDILALLRYSRETSTQPYISESWLFEPIGVAVLSNEKVELANQFYDKMKSSGSWILSITAEYVSLTRLHTIHIILSVVKEMQGEPDDQEKIETLAKRMERKQMRRASTPMENEVLTLIAEILKDKDADIVGDISIFKMKQKKEVK